MAAEDSTLEQARGTAQAADRRVLFFGDSHVLGARDPRHLGWPGRLALGSARAGLPFTLYNLGVRGETSGAVAERWEREAAPRLAPEAECRLVFSFGVNDTAAPENAAPAGGRADGHAAAVANLAEILEAATGHGLPTMVVGPAPVADAAHSDRIRDLSGAFAEVCGAAAVPFVPLAEQLSASDVWMAEVAAADGAHPAGRGYDLIAEAVLRGGWIEWLGSGAMEASGR